jgi:hypothetical protein
LPKAHHQRRNTHPGGSGKSPLSNAGASTDGVSDGGANGFFSSRNTSPKIADYLDNVVELDKSTPGDLVSICDINHPPFLVVGRISLGSLLPCATHVGESDCELLAGKGMLLTLGWTPVQDLSDRIQRLESLFQKIDSDTSNQAGSTHSRRDYHEFGKCRAAQTNGDRDRALSPTTVSVHFPPTSKVSSM